jgi:hypothetical protein
MRVPPSSYETPSMGAVLNAGVLHFRCAILLHYHLGSRLLSILKNPSSDDPIQPIYRPIYRPTLMASLPCP